MAFRAFVSIRVVEETKPPQGAEQGGFAALLNDRPDEEVSALFSAEGGDMESALKNALRKAGRFNDALSLSSQAIAAS